jgi:molecular chaperone GrpE
MDAFHDIHHDELENSQETEAFDAAENTEIELIKQCREELRSVKERYAYLASDLENVRRRAERERAQLIRSTQERLLRDMLKVMDDLERATIEQCTTGIQLVQRNFAQMLERYGVTPLIQMNHFDPHIHEAIAQVAQEGAAAGTIVDVFEKGYMFQGELLRPARVSVVAS